MGSSTEELSGDIAATRNRMASDIDALQDKVSPSAIVQRRKDAARSRILGVRDKIMGTAHDVGTTTASRTSGATSNLTGTVSDAAHGVADRAQGAVGTAQHQVHDQVQGSPLAAGLVAFGAGVVIAGLIPASHKEAQIASTVVETVKDQGAPLLEEAKSVGQQMGQDLKGTATQAAAQVKDTATESAATLKDHGQSAAEHVRNDAQGTTSDTGN